MRSIDLPGGQSLRLDHLVLDINGTLTDRGVLLDGVPERLQRLAAQLEVHLFTADTFGTADSVGLRLGLPVVETQDGGEKAALVRALGADVTAAIGNGRNDEAMLRASRLGIAVIGPEGVASAAVLAADVVCRSVTDALDLLCDDRVLVATLRP